MKKFAQFYSLIFWIGSLLAISHNLEERIREVRVYLVYYRPLGLINIVQFL